MSYPWFVFAVWFADGYDGAYQASEMVPTLAMKVLLDGFAGENEELAAEVQKHGDVVKVEYSPSMSREADAEYDMQLALDMARGIQQDANRILRVEEVTASSESEGTPPQ